MPAYMLQADTNEKSDKQVIKQLLMLYHNDHIMPSAVKEEQEELLGHTIWLSCPQLQQKTKDPKLMKHIDLFDLEWLNSLCDRDYLDMVKKYLIRMIREHGSYVSRQKLKEIQNLR